MERPVDLRLVRNLGALVALPLLLAIFTVARPGPLPAPVLPPAFDGATATALTLELAGDNASRVPGSLGAASAAQWFRDKLALYGLPVREDVWREDVPGVGRVELRNLVSVVEGTLDETIVVVAHRDNNGKSAGANRNASGTAALVELARAYATAGTTESARTPLHTLVFLSSDGGAYGSLGVARFAARSPLARRAVAVVSLDGLAGTGRTAARGRRSRPALAPACARPHGGSAHRRPSSGASLPSPACSASSCRSRCPSASGSRRRSWATGSRRCGSRPRRTGGHRRAGTRWQGSTHAG